MIRNFQKFVLTGSILFSGFSWADQAMNPVSIPNPETGNANVMIAPKPVVEAPVLTPVENKPQSEVVVPAKVNNVAEPVLQKEVVKVDGVSSEQNKVTDVSTLNPFTVNEKQREEKLKELKKAQMERRLKLGMEQKAQMPIVEASKTPEDLRKENESKILAAINAANEAKQERKAKEKSDKEAKAQKARYIGFINGKKMYQDDTTGEYFSIDEN